ncbi:hypothetical protein NGRA_1668 [Nosema granulosis]|uniref:Uncharacterized protein n=1 Tax=Nosema granulosis TaxID=83296 RepID=A0A9P6KZ52_9MICR|nr:hypothetical protein NGRA_1668 [Nosema granulosis]
MMIVAFLTFILVADDTNKRFIVPPKKRKLDFILENSITDENTSLSYQEAVSFLDLIETPSDIVKLKKRIQTSRLYTIFYIDYTMYRAGVYNFLPKKRIDQNQTKEYLFLYIKKELNSLFFKIFQDDFEFKIKKIFLKTHSLNLTKICLESFVQSLVLNSLRRVLILALCEDFLFENHKDSVTSIYNGNYQQLSCEQPLISIMMRNRKYNLKSAASSIDLNAVKFINDRYAFLFKVLYFEDNIMINKVSEIFSIPENTINLDKICLMMDSPVFNYEKIGFLEPIFKKIGEKQKIFILINPNGYKFNRIAIDRSLNLHIPGQFAMIKPTFFLNRIFNTDNVLRENELRSISGISSDDFFIVNLLLTTIQIHSERFNLFTELSLSNVNNIYSIEVIKTEGIDLKPIY